MQFSQSSICPVRGIGGMVITCLFPLLFFSFGYDHKPDILITLSQTHNLSSFSGLKHGDVHEQIAQINAMLKEDPDNAQLYYQRASLYHGHGSLEEGLADYQRAQALGYPHADLYYFMAKLYREKEEPQSGLPFINQFIETGHSVATGLIERARIYAALGQFSDAITDYNQALSMEDDVTIDYYLELAEATLQIEPEHPEKAIAVLDRAMEQLGPLVVLQLRAIEIAKQSGNMTDAMARMDQMIEGMARRESYYFKKAEMLEAAGEGAEAKKYYQLASQAIAQLPPNRKNTPAILDLQTKIELALKNK